MTASSPTYPTLGIRIWIALGTLVLIGIISLPFLFARTVSQERARFDACTQGGRVDCQTSIVWAVFGWGQHASSSAAVAPYPSF